MHTLLKTGLISRNPDVPYTQIDQEMVLLEPQKAILCSVNPIGAALWALLENTSLSLNALCNHMCQHYEVTESQCIEDVAVFINQMVALNLLRVT